MPYDYTSHQEGDGVALPQEGPVPLLPLVHLSAALVAAAAQPEAQAHHGHQDDEEQPQGGADNDPDLIVDHLQAKQEKRQVL